MSHSLVTLPLGLNVGLDYLPQSFFSTNLHLTSDCLWQLNSVDYGQWTIVCFLVVCVGLSCLLQRLIMDPGLEEEQTKLKRRTKCCKSQIIFYMLCIINFIAPVDGFSLKTCRISYSTAICVGSKLRAVPEDIPSTVTGLDLTSNRISTIHASDFKDLLNLTKLDLNINNISQIESGAFANLSSLETLNLNNNKLVTLGENVFDGLSCLIELRINQNRIKQMASTSFKSMTSLKLLDISHNKLHHITKVQLILQHLPHLRELVISNNDLTTFQSFELTNKSLELQYLDLSKNPLAVFRITADVFPNLTWFKIGSPARKKQMIWDVQNKTFLSRVTTLDISELHLGLGDMERLLESVNSSLTILRMNAMTHNLTTLINISCTIPTMRTLQLRSNKLSFVNAYLFKLCINVTELVLTDNKIKYIHDDAFRSLKNLRILTLSKNRLPLVPAATRNLPTLSELDLSTNNISTLDCHDFTNQTKLRKLYLYQNSITALKPCLFKDLKGLQTLKLQTNQITKLNSAFKEHLPNLTQLHLNGNKLTAIKRDAFKGLHSLQNLSLHQNKIKVLESKSFSGLTNLTQINLQNNDISQDELNKDVFSPLINLRRLDLSENHINYKKSRNLSDPPFSQLSHLEELLVFSQHHRLHSYLPGNFLQGLTSLLSFKARNIRIASLDKDTFVYTPQLQLLELSSNELKELPPDLFFPIPNLKSLYISRTALYSLEFLKDASLTKLEFLQARQNLYSVIREEDIKSLPALTYLDLQGNGFTCNCDNSWFLSWAINNSKTQVYDAYNFTCNYPQEFKSKKLLDLDTSSCSDNTDFICFLCTTCAILCLMVVSFTYHFMGLQLVYAYYLFIAWLFDRKHKNKKTHHQYDAFISYNTHDEPWVIDKLLPKLEGEQGWRLCLHHRDFEPGRPIIDNITDAIYGSRKTICVISRKYLESEWCSREIQAASFRLFDDQTDVLILVFMEEIPSYLLSPYHRMRKMIKRKTYLSWPRAGEHTELFWEKLCQALETREDPEGKMLLLTVSTVP
ncbi:toll-like receptor 13 isoform X2 [Haplochromis burtoni]|uniref:toll-like receptor 13 isoform X2 n=1 Tax=Haplochromis burtoni TaxID=8153 RepID=UPI001C2D9401|nr:toll-like receptor 13 isoform X2 [Haplochromis burtoni]